MRTKVLWGALAIFGGLTLAGSAWAQPAFTGDSGADFAGAGVMTVSAPDPVGDVGEPVACPMVHTGWDLQAVHWFYDRGSDTMYIGLDSVGILGDVDGNGDPDTIDPCVARLGGIDFPDFSGTEAFVIAFDIDRDGVDDFAAGVDANTDITQFGVVRMTPGDPLPFAISLGSPRPLTVIAPTDTSPTWSDIEFAIGPMSAMTSEMGVPFNPLEDPGTLLFNYEVFVGSFLDDGIGEDFVTPTLLTFACLGWDKDPSAQPLDGTPPGELITTQFAPFGLLVAGVSHSGNPGAFAYNTNQDVTTDDQIPPGCGGFTAACLGAPYSSCPDVLFTRRAPGTTDSDDGVITFSFISPFDGAPTTATFADILAIDVEDSAEPDCVDPNISYIASYDSGGGELDRIQLVNAGNNGYQCAQFAADGCDNAIRTIVADIGTPPGVCGDGDSGALDVFCYNLCPEVLPIASASTGSGSSVPAGGRAFLTYHIKNVAGLRTPIYVDAVGSYEGRPSETFSMMPSRLGSVRPRFDRDVTVGLDIPADAPAGSTIISELRIFKRLPDGRHVVSSVSIERIDVQ
jgi:hypothetical protein